LLRGGLNISWITTLILFAVLGSLLREQLARTANAIFAVFGQKRRPRPKALSWNWLIKHTFKTDPLLDRTGNRMEWVRRIPPMPVR
jgi:hypothetical protein